MWSQRRAGVGAFGHDSIDAAIQLNTASCSPLHFCWTGSLNYRLVEPLNFGSIHSPSWLYASNSALEWPGTASRGVCPTVMRNGASMMGTGMGNHGGSVSSKAQRLRIVMCISACNFLGSTMPYSEAFGCLHEAQGPAAALLNLRYATRMTLTRRTASYRVHECERVWLLAMCR